MKKSVLIPYDRYMHYKSLAVPKENNERQSETAEIAQDQTIDIPSTSRLEPSVILT